MSLSECGYKGWHTSEAYGTTKVVRQAEKSHLSTNFGKAFE